MGSIRTPRPFYFKHGVVEFFVYQKTVHYVTKVWNENGTNQSILETGKLGDQTPESIAERALQNFSSVSRT